MKITTDDLFKECNHSGYCAVKHYFKMIPAHLRKDCCHCDKDYRTNRKSMGPKGLGFYCTLCRKVDRFAAANIIRKCEICHKRFIPFPDLTTLCQEHDVPTKFTSAKRSRVRFT